MKLSLVCEQVPLQDTALQAGEVRSGERDARLCRRGQGLRLPH